MNPFVILFFGSALLLGQQATFSDHLQSAKRAEAARNLPAAEKEYEAALALREDPAILQRLGLVRHLQNKFPEAIRVFEKAVRLKPDLWACHLFLGVDYYRTNQFTKALPALTTALKLNPGQVEARFWLGATRIALKQFVAGLKVLEDLMKEQPENLELAHMLAQAYSDFAVGLLNQVPEKSPDSPQAHFIHGQALENEGAPDAALEEYRAASQLAPAMEGAHQAIGRVLWEQGKTQPAVEEFRKELALQPQEPESNYYTGRYLIVSRRPAEAVQYLETASWWTKESPEPTLELCRLWLLLGDVTKAGQVILRAVRLAPGSEDVHRQALLVFEKARAESEVQREQERWKRVTAAR